MTEREEFEAWASQQFDWSARGIENDRHRDTYLDRETASCWAAWTASRRAVQGQAAPEARMLTEQEKLRQARQALRLARNAIEPLTDVQIKLHRIPRDTDKKIESAIAAIDAAMSGAKAGDKGESK